MSLQTFEIGERVVVLQRAEVVRVLPRLEIGGKHSYVVRPVPPHVACGAATTTLEVSEDHLLRAPDSDGALSGTAVLQIGISDLSVTADAKAFRGLPSKRCELCKHWARLSPSDYVWPGPPEDYGRCTTPGASELTPHFASCCDGFVLDDSKIGDHGQAVDSASCANCKHWRGATCRHPEQPRQVTRPHWRCDNFSARSVGRRLKG